jgi:hypothetical protein
MASGRRKRIKDKDRRCLCSALSVLCSRGVAQDAFAESHVSIMITPPTAKIAYSSMRSSNKNAMPEPLASLAATPISLILSKANAEESSSALLHF